jgi:Fe-S cluster biogenesis protein NfuA
MSVQGRGAGGAGIENMLRHYIPEVIEVRPV